ncbi:hypothetical protein [Spirosoma arcticum]
MISKRFILSRSTFVVLIALLLSASALHAQTFVGREKLTESPTQLEATVYPVGNSPSTINVIFNNLTGGQVRVVIRNEKGQAVYSAFESVARYRRYLNLSYLPQGQYTVELSKQNDRYTQTFAIEPPAMSYVTMGSRPARKAPELPIDRKLIVSQ